MSVRFKKYVYKVNHRQNFQDPTQEPTSIMSRKCEVRPSGATKNEGTVKNFQTRSWQNFCGDQN